MAFVLHTILVGHIQGGNETIKNLKITWHDISLLDERIMDFVISHYRLRASLNDDGCLSSIDLDENEPMKIVFRKDKWSYSGSRVVRTFEIDRRSPIFQIVFKSDGRCSVTWDFSVEFYGIVLLDRKERREGEEERGKREEIYIPTNGVVYTPIYFHYDMVKRRCSRKIEINFDGSGECILQFHFHHDFRHSNGFSGVVIVAEKGFYRFPISLLTLGLPPKPVREELRLIHKYFTPVLVLDEEGWDEAVDTLRYLISRMPVKVVIAPRNHIDSLKKALDSSRVEFIEYDPYRGPIEEAARVYEVLFDCKPVFDGELQANRAKGWVRSATYAYLKNLRIIDGKSRFDFERETRELLFSLRVKLERMIDGLGDEALGVDKPWKLTDDEDGLKTIIEEFLDELADSEDGVRRSPNDLCNQILRTLYSPYTAIVSVLDEPDLQIALTATAYAIGKAAPIITVRRLESREGNHIKEALESLVRLKAVEEQVRSASSSLATHVLEELKREEERFLNRIGEALRRNLGGISERLKKYPYLVLFTEPLALYELLSFKGKYLAETHMFGRLSGLKPRDSVRIASAAVLTSINPARSFDAASIGIGDTAKRRMDEIIMWLATATYNNFARHPELGVKPRLYLNPGYYGYLDEKSFRRLAQRLSEFLRDTKKIVEDDVFEKVMKACREFSDKEKTVIENVLRTFKLAFIFTHGDFDPERDDSYIIVNPIDGVKLYGRDILQFGWLKNSPFIVLMACRAGMAGLESNLGLATVLLSIGASGVIANPLPIEIGTAASFVEGMTRNLAQAGSARLNGVIESFSERSRIEALFFMLYGDPTQPILPSGIAKLAFMLKVRSLYLEEDIFATSLYYRLMSYLNDFISRLVSENHSLHRQPEFYVNYCKAMKRRSYGISLLYSAIGLEKSDPAKAAKLCLRARKCFEEALRLTRDLPPVTSEYCYWRQIRRYEALATRLEANLAIKQSLNFDLDTAKSKLIEASEKCRITSQKYKEAAHKRLSRAYLNEKTRIFLDDSRRFESWRCRCVAHIALLEERFEEAGDRFVEAYLKAPKTIDDLEDILDDLLYAVIEYNRALGAASDMNKSRIKNKFMIAGMLLWHYVLLWFLSGLKGFRVLRVRELEPCDDLQLYEGDPERIKINKPTTVKWRDETFKFSPESKIVFLDCEIRKAITGMPTYVFYILYILTDLPEEWTVERFQSIIGELRLPKLDGIDKHIEKWFRNLK